MSPDRARGPDASRARRRAEGVVRATARPSDDARRSRSAAAATGGDFFTASQAPSGQAGPAAADEGSGATLGPSHEEGLSPMVLTRFTLPQVVATLASTGILAA